MGISAQIRLRLGISPFFLLTFDIFHLSPPPPKSMHHQLSPGSLSHFSSTDPNSPLFTLTSSFPLVHQSNPKSTESITATPVTSAPTQQCFPPGTGRTPAVVGHRHQLLAGPLLSMPSETDPLLPTTNSHQAPGSAEDSDGQAPAPGQASAPVGHLGDLNPGFAPLGSGTEANAPARGEHGFWFFQHPGTEN